jgi:peroxiredoxin
MPSTATDLALAPPFELPDCRGGVVRLADLLGRGPVMLVFYRGHWCPYCRRYLSKLQANLARFRERGVTLIAISPEPPATSAGLAEELGIRFPLLSDATGDVIDRYGTRNRLSAASRVVMPHPAVFILDAAGAVRFRSIDRNYQRRTTMHALFAALSELNPGGGRDEAARPPGRTPSA